MARALLAEVTAAAAVLAGCGGTGGRSGTLHYYTFAKPPAP
jgi:hypothetical protein